MALILKKGKTYKDPYNGETTTCYANIKDTGRNVNRKQQRITVEIYSSEEARQGDAIPIDSKNYVCDDFDTWFADSVLKKEGKSLESQAYEYIMQLEENTGTEEEPVMEKVWRDWEHD